jgi:SAM-dependent methyltransferase
MHAVLPTRQAITPPEWFASWFDSAHYHRLYAHRDAQEAARFIDALIERGHLIANASVLDLGCGSGRHSSYLAAKGFDVTGLDLSAESLKRARAHEGPNLRFVRQDMRLPFRIGPFATVLNLFTSFGYFANPGDHVSVIHNVASALKTGGALVLDYLNVVQADAELTPEEVVVRDGVRYQLSRWSDREHIFKRVAISDPELTKPLEFVERVAKLTLDDFRFMFSICGMRLETTYGSYRLTPFDERTSPRLILVATRTGERRDGDSLPGQLLANAAQGFGCDAEVRREHGLGNAQRNRRVDPHELEVPLLG